MSKNKRILNYLLLITIVYASFHVALFSLRFFLGSEFPLVVVEGISMEKTYYDGDLLLVKGVEDKSEIKPQDIIVFYEPYGGDKLIVHRVVERIILNNQVEFVTKGDNNALPDPWRVHEVDVVGVVIARTPAIGTVIMAIQSPFGKIFTATILIFLIGVNAYYDDKED